MGKEGLLVAITAGFVASAIACERSNADPPVTISWLDESLPSVMVASTADEVVAVSLDVVAQAGGEARTWTIELGELTGGTSVEVAVDGIDGLASMRYASTGITLAVRMTISEPRTGRALDFGSASDRVVWFDGDMWSLRLRPEVLSLLEAVRLASAPGADLLYEVETIEPGASMTEEVP